MNHITDPQGLAHEGRPYDPRTVEIMGWLASPDGGALRTDQACHVAREIAHGRVPHVSMIPMPVMTVDGGRTWTTIPAGIAAADEVIVVSQTISTRKVEDNE